MYKFKDGAQWAVWLSGQKVLAITGVHQMLSATYRAAKPFKSVLGGVFFGS